MPLCIPYQVTDAFHESEVHEHSIFHVPEHQEDDHSCAEEDFETAIQ